MIDIGIIKSGTAIKDFTGSLVKPLQTDSDEANLILTDLQIKSKYNGQHMMLRKALQELSGIANIDVVTIFNIVVQMFVFGESEIGAVTVYVKPDSDPFPIFVFGETEVADAVDFRVMIPFEDADPETIRQITTWTNIFKLAGKTFDVTDDLMILQTTLTSAQILLGNTNPVDLVPAPGAGKIAVLIGAYVSMDYNSIAYATNVNFDILCNGVALTAQDTGFLSATADRFRFLINAGAAITADMVNKAIQFKVATGNPTAGNSVIKITAIYKIVNF